MIEIADIKMPGLSQRPQREVEGNQRQMYADAEQGQPRGCVETSF